LRTEGARLDGDAQLRVGNAGTRFAINNIRAGRSNRVAGGVDALSRAPFSIRRDGRLAGELVRGEDARPARGAAARSGPPIWRP
jgi:hypothetical protein